MYAHIDFYSPLYRKKLFLSPSPPPFPLTVVSGYRILDLGNFSWCSVQDFADGGLCSICLSKVSSVRKINYVCVCVISFDLWCLGVKVLVWGLWGAEKGKCLEKLRLGVFPWHCLCLLIIVTNKISWSRMYYDYRL